MHYLKTGELIKVDIPSMPEIAEIQVECNIVNDTVIRVNYARHQVSVGEFRDAYSVITFENAIDQDGNQLSGTEFDVAISSMVANSAVFQDDTHASGKILDKVNDHTIIVQNHATSSKFKSYEQTLKSDNNMDLWYQSGRSYRFICTTADMAQTTNYYMMSEKSLRLELDQKYTLSTFKSPDYYYGPGMYGDRRKVKVQSSPSYYVDGEKHIPNLHPHSCTQPGAKVFRIDGTMVYAMCNIPGHGMTCSLEENTLKNSIIVTISNNGGNLQNITLTKPLIASYNSGKVILKRDGVQAMATKVEIASINDNIKHYCRCTKHTISQ